MSFGLNVSKWVDQKAKKGIEKLRKAIMLELFNSVILDTPVDTGRLRGNWQISTGSPMGDIIDVIDPSGKATMLKVEELLDREDLLKDQEVYLTNNLPYAYRIEFDGWSQQAPEGMVRRNAIRISNNLAQSM